MNLQLASRVARAALLTNGFALMGGLVSFAQTRPVATQFDTTSYRLTGIIATSDQNYWSVYQGDSLCGQKGESCGTVVQIGGSLPDGAFTNYVFGGSGFPVTKGNYPIGSIEGPDCVCYKQP